jgi:energy-coupling factor transport system ATP-binding protein
MRERVDRALTAIGIEHLRSRPIATLSGGERQRAALAAALALTPRLVVLDEPASQLDEDGSERLAASCIELARAGMAVVVAEHRAHTLAGAAYQTLTLGEPTVPSLPCPPRGEETRYRGRIAWSLEGVAAGPGGEPVLEAVDLAGAEGETVVLMGPNGGGKTTLLRVIAGLLKPRAGKSERRPGRAAYLPQNPSALLHRPTVRAEVTLTLERGGSGEEPDLILDELGLLHLAARYPRDLSSGERQRAAIAAVLAGSPKLVLLDEPTRGMDDAARASLVGVAARLKRSGAALVVATHDRDLAAQLADRIVRVEGGRAAEVR